MISIDTADPSPGTPHGAPSPAIIGECDIVFACPTCSGELVVDREGAGIQVPCPHCGQALTIPGYQPASSREEAAPESKPSPPSPSPRTFDFSDQTLEQLERRLGELKHQLKENRSQDTEMRGHVNRATMELHRLQLRLKKLQERQTDIEAELTALESFAKG